MEFNLKKHTGSKRRLTVASFLNDDGVRSSELMIALVDDDKETDKLRQVFLDRIEAHYLMSIIQAFLTEKGIDKKDTD